jgi:hypothetical protein
MGCPAKMIRNGHFQPDSVEKFVDCGAKRSDSGAFSALAKAWSILLHLPSHLFSMVNRAASGLWGGYPDLSRNGTRNGSFPQLTMNGA